MAKARWVGDDLWYLLNLPLQELRKRYPNYSEGGLKSKRSYWRTKLLNGEIEMPEKPPQSEPERQTLKSWEVAMRGQDGEWDVTTLHSYGHSLNVEEQFTPAAPANITPTTEKAPERGHKILVVFSDAQIDYRRLNNGELQPIHDERALAVGQLLCADLKPDEIINLGDTIDLAALSRFKPDSDHFHRTLGPSFQRVHDYYAQLRADNPWAKITEVDSNHNTRLKDFMLKYVPSMYGLTRAGEEGEYPVFTYPFLANLDKLGVEWVSGYGAAEYIYGAEYDTPPIVFKHGTIVASQASTAARESKENPENHVVRGHTHRIETHYRTTRKGNYLASVVCGVMCRTTGEVPSYHSAVDDRGTPVKYQENWQTGLLVIEDYEGEYTFNHVPIRGGRAFYKGKEYRSE